MSHVIYKNRSVIQDFGTGKTLAEISRVTAMPYHLTLDILSINSAAKQ